ncbi:MAG: glycosyltransferase family 4 protein, partial [Nocardioidaceae bacterium]
LIERGARVTVFCAAHAAAPPEEIVDGLRFVRCGTKLSVYAHGLLHLVRGAFGPVDLVVDVQNGLPFFTRLATRRPVVVLVHHVHREQWPVVYPGVAGRVGWWIEHRLSPFLYRRCQYVTVSHATRDELAALGVAPGRIAIVHGGTDPVPEVDVVRAPQPTICVVGRLVPHKQVEHAVDTICALRAEGGDVRLFIVGRGWWGDSLKKYVANSGVADLVTFTGHVDERRKHEIYAQSWLLALPSLKEGWALVVGEAGLHGTPTVAYASAGGTRESIQHMTSGLLASDTRDFTESIRALLADEHLRCRLGEGARATALVHTWERAEDSFAHVVEDVLHGRRTCAEDPEDP